MYVLGEIRKITLMKKNLIMVIVLGIHYNVEMKKMNTRWEPVYSLGRRQS